MDSTKEQVRKVLEIDPQSRNSDTRLFQMMLFRYNQSLIFKDEDGDWAIKLRNLYEAPNKSDLQRYRAYWQNEKHLFLPTSSEVRRQRKINEELWHSKMSPSNPSKG